MKIITFDKLSKSDLIIDAIYEGGNKGDGSDDPISKILPVGIQGGFRYNGSIDKPKYIIFYSSGEHLDWPDKLNSETGIFQYYGDNRKPGNELYNTKRKGNKLFEKLFNSIYDTNNPREYVPPIFIFKKYPTSNSNRSVQFKGLCVPGAKDLTETQDLITIWKNSDGNRFQNYLAHFTILDEPIIKRDYLNDLNNNLSVSINAPKAYVDWKKKGKYSPLITEKTLNIRKKIQQLPDNSKHFKILEKIYTHFKSDPYKFEEFAAEVYKLSNSNILIDEITKRSSDGGRDAIGRLKLGVDSDPVYVEFALEAKCYNPGINSKINTVGSKEVSRLISRIRNRQYGVIVTTSVIGENTYKEVRNDKHPIIFISGVDLVEILVKKGINSSQKLKKYLNLNY